jgi:hypothetical protein
MAGAKRAAAISIGIVVALLVFVIMFVSSLVRRW